MTKSTLLRIAAPITLLAVLSACNSKSDANEPAANSTEATAPVELPPMMIAQKTYRCKDNSLVYIDFFNNNTAVFRAERTAPTGTHLTAAAEGEPYVAEGFSLSGSGDEVSLTTPDKGTTDCKA